MPSHMRKALKTELGTHNVDYLVLITATVFFLLFLKFFQGERNYSYLTVLTFSAFYVVWGIIHHMRDDSVHLKNVLEYILISFGVLLLMIVLFAS